MTTYNIRGGLGTQVHQLVGIYAHALEHGNQIEKIHVNISDTSDTIANGTTCLHHRYIDNLFTFFHEPEIEYVESSAKFPMIPDPGFNKAALVHKHIGAIRQIIKPKKSSSFKFSEIIHCRAGDRQLVDTQTFIDEVRHQNYMLIGDDHDVLWTVKRASKFSPAVSPYESDLTGVIDWLALVHTDGHLTGPLSTYTLTAALFNPNLRVSWYGFDKQNGKVTLGQNVYETFDFYISTFSNMNWRI